MENTLNSKIILCTDLKYFTVYISAVQARVAEDLGSTMMNLHMCTRIHVKLYAYIHSLYVIHVCVYTFSKLVSNLETSGWIQSCSLEPMIAIRGL